MIIYSKATKNKILEIIKIKYIFFVLFIISFLINFFASFFGSEYHMAIDPLDGWYRAFSEKHLLSLLIYEILFFASTIIVFIKRRNLPPLTLSICIIFIIVGITLNMLSIIQYLDFERILFWHNHNIYRRNNVFGMFNCIINIIFSFTILIKIIRQESNIALHRQYKNRFLNKINTIIGTKCFLWSIILFIPILTVITLILIIFGQEKDSIIKVWTETTTWTFSQKEHPPFLDHTGHYLCTIAACGHSHIVKPLRLGTRKGRIIIVNRQLMIANAYEDLLKRKFSKIHKVIRFVYDKYGYPISKYITNKYISDIIYFLMKPLEYLFLINLYLFELNPEKLISKQYK